MMLLSHIFVAVFSIILASISWFRPTRTLLFASYSLVGATLATGIGLVVTASVSMLHLCLSGLTYTIITIAILTMARQKQHIQEHAKEAASETSV